MAAARCIPMLAKSAVAVCPMAGVEAAAANVTDKRKCRFKYMPTSLSIY
jgi:hypothetical protein